MMSTRMNENLEQELESQLKRMEQLKVDKEEAERRLGEQQS